MVNEARQFHSFVDRASALLGGSILAQQQRRFAEFIEAARPMAAREAIRLQKLLARRLRALRPWLISPRCDLLSVAGLSFDEDAYTELVAWALRKETHPPSAKARQWTWLAEIGIPRSLLPTEPGSIRTQVHTDDGIPDLVMDCGSLIVVVEAKTGTLEHGTPGGKPQTDAYEPAVRRLLGRPDAAVYTVFLTTDGTIASNPTAINTTYARVVFALAGAMNPAELPPDALFAFGMLFTHLLAHGTALHTHARGTLRELLAWDESGELDVATAIQRLPMLQAISTTIRSEEEQ